MNNLSKRRIAFIVPFLYRYQRGIERSCVYLANALADLGHEVTLFTWQENPIKTDFKIHPHVCIFTIPKTRYYRKQVAILFYFFELIKNRYDIVNIYFSGYGEGQALRLARNFRRFMINFIVGYPIEQVPYRFQEFRENGLEKLLDNIIVKSPSMASGIARFFQKEVQVISNGIDVSYFDPEVVNASELRQKLGLCNDDKVLLTVAALEERKGVQYIIKALPFLLQTGHTIHYVVVGDGPNRKMLETLANEAEVDQYVHFTGAIKDVRPYYKLADVFCLLSYGEGFPNVLLEAWAMGLPVIVSQHPPYPDLIKNKTLGKCVNEEDLDALVEESIAMLAAFPSLEATNQKQEIRFYVKNRYSWSRVARELMLLSDNSGVR